MNEFPNFNQNNKKHGIKSKLNQDTKVKTSNGGKNYGRSNKSDEFLSKMY